MSIHTFVCYAKIEKNNQKGAQKTMYFYQRLRDCREDKDMKQKEIAEILKDTQQHYQLYESGKREMPMHLFIVLAKYYNVSIDYLAGLTNDKRKFW